MRRTIALVVSSSIALVLACKTPDEPASQDAAPTSSASARASAGATATASATATTSASSAPTANASPSASAASSADAGAPTPLAAFCQSAYTSDQKELAKRCKPEELAPTRGLINAAIAGCTKSLGELAARKRVTFEPTSAAACLKALEAAAAANDPEPMPMFARAPCDKILTGTQDEGKPCSDPQECKAGLACVGFLARGSEGTCKKPGAAGATCSNQFAGPLFTNELTVARTHLACAKGLYCSGNSCASRTAVGAVCSSDGQCVEGARCLMGKCSKSPRAAAAQPCAKASDCATGLWCDGSKCAPKKKAGEACTDKEGECRGYCEVPGGKRDGVCVASCGSG